MVFVLPFALLRFWWKNRRNSDALGRWRERLGLIDLTNDGRDLIWIHAVSVGESNVAQPLIDKIVAVNPSSRILVTTTTATGANTVMSRYADEVTHRYFPFDLKCSVRSCFKKLKPRVVILIETELWPNFLAVADEFEIPVVLINGRLSERAANRYRRAPKLTAQMLNRLTLIAAQSVHDADRFKALGGRAENVVVTGSMKFDRELAPSVLERGEAIRRELGSSRFVFMAGSTRDGEEELLLAELPELVARIPKFLMVVAPRHPERFTVVEEMLARHRVPYQSYQQRQTVAASTQVYLLDVMGELTNYYAAADIAFVGGSLAPFGGQNTLEPAGLGVPILVGPHTYNFASVNSKLSAAGALHVVQNAAQLTALTIELSNDSNRRDQMGLSAKQVFRDNRGALKQVLSLLERYLVDEK